MPNATLPRKQVPAAFAVLTIAGVMVLILFSAITLLAWNSYTDAIERARVRAASSAHVVSAHMQWLMAAGLKTLEEVDRMAGPDPASISADLEARYRQSLSHLPAGIEMAVVDAAGKPSFSTAAGKYSITPESVSGVLTPGGRKLWSVSPLQIDEKSGEHFFLIKHRMIRNGETAGAAVLIVPASLIAEFWMSLDLGPQSTVGMMRDDGWQVARYPSPDKPSNFSNYILFTDYLKQAPDGVYDAYSPVDGVQRIVGYRKVPDAPLVVVATVGRDFALIPLKEQMWRLAYFLIPLMLGLGALAFWVARLLKRDDLMRQSLAVAVERNNWLMREIHHRTKNNLQSVASLVKLQPISDEAKAAMNARIAAMSAVHEQAYRMDLYAEVNLRDYLRTLIGNISKSDSGRIGIETELADVAIDRDMAQPLGLVVNEVISNAMKHAFECRDEGRIIVRLAMIADDKAELVIHDNGKGYDPEAQSGSGSGMGTRLIRAFAHQLGNDYTYAYDNGTRFTIRFAAKARQAMA
jgi:two-component system, sensor histidine kinase PdtaS